MCIFGGVCERIAFVVFATEAIAEKMMEAAQGSDIRGNSIFIDYAGEKSTSLLGQLLYNLYQVWMVYSLMVDGILD